MTTATPTVPPATAGTILALDLGKYKSVSCLYTGSADTARFDSFTTDRARLAKLLTRCQPAVVVIEACLLAGWVHDLCADLGLRCLVANTASEAWKFKHLKRKTDRDDALRLAQLYSLGQLPTVALPPPATRQWRALIATRQTLVGRRVAVQNRIRALFVAQGLPAPRPPPPPPPPPPRQWRALTAPRQTLVGRRVAVQNRIRALFVAQGLPAPRGAKAWTRTGLDGLALQAEGLKDCAPDELWRG